MPFCALGWLLAAAVVALPALARAQQLPPGYPAGYADVIKGAQAEGLLVVHSTTDSASAAALLDDFKSLYPFVSIEYGDLNSSEVYDRFVSATAAGTATADLVWSSAMDLQMKLVKDGLAQTYESPELHHLPDWAVAGNQAYGTTLEPLVMVYNTRLMQSDTVPRSHGDFLHQLQAKPDAYKGKLATYDAEHSAVGFMLASQDARQWPAFWDMAAAFGKVGAKYYTSVAAMLEKVSSGEHLLAYNVFGSYALFRKQTDKSLGIVYPTDYTLAISRIAFIGKAAKHPNAAKLFLDYLLSKRGQSLMANKAFLNAIRDDVEGEATAGMLKRLLGAKLRPVPVSTAILEDLEPKRHLEILNLWKKSARAE